MKQLKNRILVSDLLKDARRIVARAWGKGGYVTSRDGKVKDDLERSFGIPDDDDDTYIYCSDGALRRAVKNLIRQSRENISKSKSEMLLERSQEALARSVRKKTPDMNPLISSIDKGAIWHFNDDPDRTQKEVLEAFDDAIEDQCKQVQELAEEEGLWPTNHTSQTHKPH